MTGQKKKRALSALISGAIMLFTILVSILVYQLVSVVQKYNEIKRLDEEIYKIQVAIDSTRSEIESWGYAWKIEERARELGLYFDNEE